MFQEGFLLTTGKCALNILHGMIRKRQTGTVLLRGSDLKTGQRVVILDISYTSARTMDDNNLGLVMVS